MIYYKYNVKSETIRKNCNYLAAVEVVVKVGLLAEAAAAVGTHHLLPVVRHLGVRGQVPSRYYYY